MQNQAYVSNRKIRKRSTRRIGHELEAKATCDGNNGFEIAHSDLNPETNTGKAVLVFENNQAA